MKGWVTCPFAMTTDLQVVLKYQLIPVAPCSHDSFWNIWPGVILRWSAELLYPPGNQQASLHF